MNESPLIQRKISRLTNSPGVIDTRQLHRHYLPIQTTTERLLQRLQLPESINTRYQAGVIPNDRIGRFQLQRRETFGDTATIWRVREQGNEKVGENGVHLQSLHSETPISTETEANPPIIARPQSFHSEATHSTGKFRISRQPKAVGINSALLQDLPLESVNTQENSLIQTKKAISTSYQPSIVAPETPLGTTTEAHPQPIPIESITPMKQFRISRQPKAVEVNDVLSPDLPLPANRSENSLIQAKQAINTSYQPSNLDIGTETKTNQQSELVLRMTDTTPYIERQKVDREKETPNSNTEVSSINTTTTLDFLHESNHAPPTHGHLKVSRETAHPCPPQKWGELKGQLIQRLPSAKESNTRTPILERIQSKEASPNPYPNLDTPLPLAINTTNTNTLISRQTDSSPSISATPSQGVAAPANLPTSNSNIDIAQIAEQVSRIIFRQLEIERERRGKGR